MNLILQAPHHILVRIKIRGNFEKFTNCYIFDIFESQTEGGAVS